MAFYIVSERNANFHVAWGTSYEFEDIIARTCNGNIIAPRQLSVHPKLNLALGKLLNGRYKKIPDFKFADEKNVLLLIGMGPQPLKILDKLGPWREKCDVVAAYIVDLYPGSYGMLDVKIANKLDCLYLSYQQIIGPISKLVKCPVHLIFQAADALGQGGFGGERAIDIVGYGRQKAGVHQILQPLNENNSGKVYFHSTFAYQQIKNWKEDRQLFWKIMQMSKLALCYRYEDTNPQWYRGVSPITARWFEAIAGGCAIVGSRPSGPEGTEQFDWKDSIIDLPENNNKILPFVEALIADRQRLKDISRRNYYHALTRHDWRLRLEQMLGFMKLEIPEKLKVELEQLKIKAKNIGEV